MKVLLFPGERIFDDQFFLLLTKVRLTHARVNIWFSQDATPRPVFLGVVEPFQIRKFRVRVPADCSRLAYSLVSEQVREAPFVLRVSSNSRVCVFMPLMTDGLFGRMLFGRATRKQIVSGETVLVHAELDRLFEVASWKRTRHKTWVCNTFFDYVRTYYSLLRRVSNIFPFRDSTVRGAGELYASLTATPGIAFPQDVLYSDPKVYAFCFHTPSDLWLSDLRAPSHISKICVFCRGTAGRSEILENATRLAAGLEPRTELHLFFLGSSSSSFPGDRFETLSLEMEHALVKIHRPASAREKISVHECTTSAVVEKRKSKIIFVS